MKRTLYSIIAFIFLFTSTSCSRYLQSGNGGFSDVSLNRNSDEYSIKRLKQIEMDGNAICGIPGLFGAKNNKNKNKTGMMFRFNGIEIGRTPRIWPILSMVTMTYGVKSIIKIVGGEKLLMDNSYIKILGVVKSFMSKRLKTKFQMLFLI